MKLVLIALGLLATTGVVYAACVFCREIGRTKGRPGFDRAFSLTDFVFFTGRCFGPLLAVAVTAVLNRSQPSDRSSISVESRCRLLGFRIEQILAPVFMRHVIAIRSTASGRGDPIQCC